jgi:DNA-binding NtrC family response regulator
MACTVVAGPGTGKVFHIEADRIRIGSAADNSIVLDDATVSRYHAEIHQTSRGLLLRDLDSTNGTFVGGNQVREMYLKPSTQVQFGGTTLAFSQRVDSHIILAERSESYAGLLGGSLVMRQLFGMLRRVAATDVTVILHGETGSGKEVCARAIHDGSRRRESPFVVLDCSALDQGLAGSEIFGHVVGAFTGAVGARPGAFESSEGGTVFIDELGELPPDLQTKLLRVLETREVKRLGSQKSQAFDCRIVAATHRNLEQMVEEGRFRQDLYYRLNQVVVEIPPLRERREDIPRLAQSFLAATNRATGRQFQITAESLERLSQEPFKGNVRELKNLIVRACTLAESDVLTTEHLLTRASPPRPASPAAAPAGSLREAERVAIESALRLHHYNRRLTAEHLGITRPTLRKRIREYGIVVPSSPDDDKA